MSTTTYPVRVDGSMDDRLNRWLWLVKWVLVIPHLFVLAVLWIGFVLLSFVAFFAILFTGRYPRGIFDYNVGVLRWTWRVQFYAYGALGTDKYPPFTLQDVPGYPAHLDVAYPEHLSRGLVLVKWWLLAIPHYLVVGFFIGGTWFALHTDRGAVWTSGLVGLLVFVAAIVLLFTGRYPRPIFDLVLGMDRWVLRVAAYAGLMVDQYPPFRLDMGGDDPGTTRLDEPPLERYPRPAGPPPREPAPRQPAPRGSAPRMSAGRTIALVAGVLVTLTSMLGLLVAGGLAWLDQTQRDSAGFVTSDRVTLSTTGYALTSEDLTIDAGGTSVPHRWFGDARVRVETVNGAPVFVGLASAADVRRYLAGVEYTTVKAVGPNTTTYSDHAGTAPSTSPAELTIWRAQAAGLGEQTITWPITNGNWTLVVMAQDGSKNLRVRADVGATAPGLEWLWIAILSSSGLFLVLGTLAVVLAVARQPKPGPSTLQRTPGPPVE